MKAFKALKIIFPANAIASKWSSEVYVYRDQLQMMANKLQDLSGENGYDEFQEPREYYLDQLTDLSIALDRFTHTIRQNEAALQQMKQQSPGTRLEELRQKYHAFESGIIGRIEQKLIEVHLDFECFSFSYSL